MQTSRLGSDQTGVALRLRERLLFAVGIQVACVALRAAELLAGEGWRGGRVAAVGRESGPLRR